MEEKQIHILDLLSRAGSIIREIGSHQELDVSIKADRSPVTLADRESDLFIRKELGRIDPGTTVLSEELENMSLITAGPEKFWLLDPLDGTKEFIKGNGEYCISLALIENGRPLEGYIYSPTDKILWYALKSRGAYKVMGDTITKLPSISQKPGSPLVLLRSRSHHKKEEQDWYEKASSIQETTVKQQGSAIKFCHIAEGYGDFYIKKGRIFGWDIAAGDLIISESGGKLIAYGNKAEISYPFNKSPMPHFLACGSRIKNPENYLF